MKYLFSFQEADLKTLASKLITKNCTTGEILCDQGEVCHSLYVLKNGQINLVRVIKKKDVDISGFARVLQDRYKEIPDTIEVEVKVKFNAGDMFLLSEVLKARPLRYKIKVCIPSQVYACTVFDIRRYVGIEKFLKVPDADYFGSSDSDLLKYELEKRSWNSYKDNLIMSQINENSKKDFYTSNKKRSGISHFKSQGKIELDAQFYFQSRQRFFLGDQEEIPEVTKELEKIQKSLTHSSNFYKKKMNPKHQAIPYGSVVPEHREGYQNGGNRIRERDGLHHGKSNRIDREKEALESNEYINPMDNEHIDNILKYQCKKIVGAAYTEWLVDKRKTKYMTESKGGSGVKINRKSNSINPSKSKAINSSLNLQKLNLEDFYSEADDLLSSISKSRSAAKVSSHRKKSNFIIRSNRATSMSYNNPMQDHQ